MNSSTESVKAPQYFEGKHILSLNNCVLSTDFISIVIRHFFFTNDPENYNLLHFYNLNKDFIISNSYQWEIKSTWKKRFLDVAKQLNKDMVSEIIVFTHSNF